MTAVTKLAKFRFRPKNNEARAVCIADRILYVAMYVPHKQTERGSQGGICVLFVLGMCVCVCVCIIKVHHHADPK